MKHTLVTPELSRFPETFHPLLTGCRVFDSSCSQQAQVWFLERDGGLYLKRSPRGTLTREAAMTRFFHEKGLAAEVLAYESGQEDWLLTAAVPGEDCTHREYRDDPRRLSALLGEQLRQLHSLPWEGCPVPDHTARYLARTDENFQKGVFDPQSVGASFPSPEAAMDAVTAGRHLLQTDTLLHGDYCLPNIILDNWRFSGFIDLDQAGVGDRHVDLFWGVWTLQFNLHTDIWGDRFLDAYGRDVIDDDVLHLISAAEVFG